MFYLSKAKTKIYHLLLNRLTNFEFTKEDVEAYLKDCKDFNKEVSARGFFDFMDGESFNFNEEVENTYIEDDSQFYDIIKELEND